jgi:DNA-binding PadR family transcriptional regulator
MHPFHAGRRFGRFARDAFRHGHGPGPDHGHDHGPGFGRGGRGRDGGPGRHERGGGRSRVFDHGELRYVVLALIAEKPRHGYELIKAIEERTAGAYSPSPGVIYPTLTLLEELGHVSVADEGGKRQHAITAEGSAWLAANQPAVDAAMARMEGVREAHGGGPDPQIVRAAENLRLSLRLRQSRGPLTEDQTRAIAAALDAAAVAIERS